MSTFACIANRKEEKLRGPKSQIRAHSGDPKTLENMITVRCPCTPKNNIRKPPKAITLLEMREINVYQTLQKTKEPEEPNTWQQRMSYKSTHKYDHPSLPEAPKIIRAVSPHRYSQTTKMQKPSRGCARRIFLKPPKPKSLLALRGINSSGHCEM